MADCSFSKGCVFLNFLKAAAALLTVLLAVGSLYRAPTAEIYFFDVGQADCILIRLPDEDILIDAGNTADGPLVADMLVRLGIERIDRLVATHPHEDHIGGMADVIKRFPVGRFYAPIIKQNHLPDTECCRNFYSLIATHAIPVTPLSAGVTIKQRGLVNLFCLSPDGGEYERLNGYSAVLKLTVDKRVFLFAADAERVSEGQMIASGYSLDCDVLKCGHHGSNTSSGADFLRACSPSYTVISVGEENEHGYPSHSVLGRLRTVGSRIFRTDTDGTVMAVTDGKSIRFEFFDICLDGD